MRLPVEHELRALGRSTSVRLHPGLIGHQRNPDVLSVLARLGNSEPQRRGSDGGFFLEIEKEIKADQEMLRDVMRTLGVEESKVRKVVAWAAEKVGRARLVVAGDEPNGLGLVLTLEGLIMGVTGKKMLWRTLAAAKLPELNSYDFEELQRRAEQQVEHIEAERMLAIRQAFTEANRSK